MSKKLKALSLTLILALALTAASPALAAEAPTDAEPTLLELATRWLFGLTRTGETPCDPGVRASCPDQPSTSSSNDPDLGGNLDPGG